MSDDGECYSTRRRAYTVMMMTIMIFASFLNPVCKSDLSGAEANGETAEGRRLETGKEG